MLHWKFVLNIVIISLFELLAQIFVKTYYEQNDRKLYLIFLSWLMYLGVVYFLYRAYSGGNFAITNSFWNALTTVLVAIVGWVYYKEHLNKYELTGIGFVVVGLVILGTLSDGGEKAKKD